MQTVLFIKYLVNSLNFKIKKKIPFIDMCACVIITIIYITEVYVDAMIIFKSNCIYIETQRIVRCTVCSN